MKNIGPLDADKSKAVIAEILSVYGIRKIKLAKKLGVTPGAIYLWEQRGMGFLRFNHLKSVFTKVNYKKFESK